MLCVRVCSHSWSACALLYLVACGSDQGPGTGPEETLGIPFTPPMGLGSSGTQLAWTPDGAELVFTAGAEAAFVPLEAFRVFDGTQHTVDARLRNRGPLHFAAAGQWVCGYSNDTGSPSVETHDCVSMADGSVLVLTSRAAFGLNVFGSLVSTADGLIAYGVKGPECVPGLGGSTCDSMYVHNLSAGTTRFLTIGLPDAFSPDGQALLYRGRPCDETGGSLNSCTLNVLDLATGNSTEIWRGVPEDILWLSLWGPSGPRRIAVAKGLNDTLVIRDLLTRSTRIVHILNRSDWVWSAALSLDGQLLAYWLVSGEGISRLQLYRLGTGTTTQLALAYGTDPGPIALSPDGHRIAYAVGGRGFWDEVP
jgi:hypothetical protein